MSELEAIEEAAYLAASGPRVAAVVFCKGDFQALPGFMDEDTDTVKQVALLTPDGRVWQPL